jgi:ketosteroid isomerase-like protein
VKWHVAGTNPLAGDFIGIDAVLGAMRRYDEHSQHTLRLDTRSVFADEHHAIAVHWATAHREGFIYQAHEIDVFHLSGGLITELWSFSEDQDATDELWS